MRAKNGQLIKFSFTFFLLITEKMAVSANSTTTYLTGTRQNWLKKEKHTHLTSTLVNVRTWSKKLLWESGKKQEN